MDFLATSKFVDVVIDDFEQNMQISVDLFSNIEVRSAKTKTFFIQSQCVFSYFERGSIYRRNKLRYSFWFLLEVSHGDHMRSRLCFTMEYCTVSNESVPFPEWQRVACQVEI